MGPMSVKSNNARNKTWIALFTRLATRVAHLEFMISLSSEEFLEGSRRFIARREMSKLIICYNGPQFQFESKALAMVMQDAAREDVTDYCGRQEIEWKFINQFLPWSGGVYERHVGLAKNALRKVIGRRFILETNVDTFSLLTTATK